jgi:uncharacterized glyoxalase superfamily protein PhnB
MAQVKPIPDGQHAVTPQLVFQDTSKAMAFYAKVFGAKEVARVPGPGGKIWHAVMEIGDSKIFMNDAMPGMAGEVPSAGHPSAASVFLYVPDADAVMKRAAEGGAKVAMPCMDLFWGDRGGLVIDPFGYAWFVATHVKDLSEEEGKRAYQEALKQAQSGART